MRSLFFFVAPFAFAACGDNSPAQSPDLAVAFDFAMPDLTPRFDLTPVDLTAPSDLSIVPDLSTTLLAINLTGIGTVTSSPAGITCPTSCAGNFPFGTPITLAATGQLKSWGSGPCAGTSGASCAFTPATSGSQSVAFYAAGNFPATAYALAADATSLNPTTAITVEAWANLTAASEPTNFSHVSIVRKGTPFTAGSTGYQLGYLYLNGDFEAEFAVADAGNVYGCDSGALTAGKHALAGEYDSATGNLFLYVDGARACGGAGNAGALTPATGASLTLGAPPGDANPFAGVVDEVQLSNVSRYSGTSYTPARHPTADANTIALWHFDEGAGTTAADASGNNNNAGLVGSGFTWVAEP